MDPRVSVVIPVHNTAPYLEQCIGSVLDQTLRDLEVIAVDDASTDDSLSILRRFEAADGRVRVIAAPSHIGVSAARNAGIDAAGADYVYFLDSDDWIDGDYLEKMLEKALETGQAVVVNSNYVEEFPSRQVFHGRHGFMQADAAFYPVDIVQSRLLSAMMNRLYSRRYLNENGIRFPLVEGGGEDTCFCSLAEVLQPRSFVFRGPYYHYRQRSDSVFHIRPRGSFSYIENYRILYDELRKRQVPLDGLALFHTGHLVIDSEEQFDFLRALLMDLEPQMRANPELYSRHDWMLLDVLHECPDYATVLAGHSPQITSEFIRELWKKKQL